MDLRVGWSIEHLTVLITFVMWYRKTIIKSWYIGTFQIINKSIDVEKYIKFDLIITWKSKQSLETFYKKMWVKQSLYCLLTMKIFCPIDTTLRFCHIFAFSLFVIKFLLLIGSNIFNTKLDDICGPYWPWVW